MVASARMGLVITLNLRDDIVWSDGTPLTAEDFVFTYEMIVNPGNTVASVYPYDYLESVEATDERTVVMTFAEPFAPWQASFWRGILPKHVLEPVFEAKAPSTRPSGTCSPTVSCGPYLCRMGVGQLSSALSRTTTTGWASQTSTRSTSSLCRTMPRKQRPSSPVTPTWAPSRPSPMSQL